MSNIERFGLVTNPFHHLVADGGADFWAGAPKTKKALGDVVRSVQPDDIGASEFVLLAGSWGGGKTHAMRYFSRQVQQKQMGYPFYAKSTKQSEKNIFVVLFKSIIEENGREFFLELESKVGNAIDRENILLGGSRDSKERIISKNFRPFDRNLVKKCMLGEGNAFKFLQDCNEDAKAVALMASLIRVMITPIGNQDALYPAVYFFLDEVEEMINEKPAVAFAFWRSCRALIDQIDGNFAMICAFSEESTALLDAVLPAYILARQTRPYIQIPAFNDQEAKDFIKDFLREKRLPNNPPPHPFYPFTEEAIDFILEKEVSLLPRKIILTMGRVFKRGIEKLGEQEEFSKEIAEEVLSDMVL